MHAWTAQSGFPLPGELGGFIRNFFPAVSTPVNASPVNETALLPLSFRLNPGTGLSFLYQVGTQSNPLPLPLVKFLFKKAPSSDRKRYLQDASEWAVVFTETVGSPWLPSLSQPLPDCRPIRSLASDPYGLILCLSQFISKAISCNCFKETQFMDLQRKLIFLCRVVEEN